MSQPTNGESGDWHLGVAPEGKTETKVEPGAEESKPAQTRDLSAERLKRPLYVLTAEHLGWLLVFGWAIASRLVALGARPLTQAEAGSALAALGTHPVLTGNWFIGLQSALFSAAGPGDFFARLPSALFGLVLVGAAFAMRRELGRAGALGFAALLTLSPTFTYYSRWDSTLVPALALTVVAIALLYWTMRKPGGRKVVVLGVVVALALSVDPVSIPTAAALAVILIALGIWQALRTDESGVRLRVWWVRWRRLAIVGVVVAVVLYFTFETDFFQESFASAIAAQARASWASGHRPGFLPGIAFYLPEFAFYEFFIAVMAIAGFLAMAAYRLRSRLALVVVLWTAAGAAFYLWTPARHPQWILAIILPAALLGGLTIDWLHHTRAWRFARYPIVALALLTLYAQVLNTFVRIAPDSTEAPWARHELLYWRAPTTTVSTPVQCERALRSASNHSSVFFETKAPVLGWYLRSLKTASDRQDASVIVSAPGARKQSGASEESRDFTFQQSWQPVLTDTDAYDAIRYFLTARVWAPVKSKDIRLTVRRIAAPRTRIFVPPGLAAKPTASPSPVPSPAASPTSSPVASPATSPSPSAGLAAPTASPSPAMSPTPATSPTLTASPTPVPSPTPAAAASAAASPSPSASPSPTASPSPSASPSPTASPSPAASATPSIPSGEATPGSSPAPSTDSAAHTFKIIAE